jgi:hypothetical protein
VHIGSAAVTVRWARLRVEAEDCLFPIMEPS